ncbi:TonB-dependent receptor [Filimonas lacunae]|nr:TonB-dependent receptor [Filimonas lacunae]
MQKGAAQQPTVKVVKDSVVVSRASGTVSDAATGKPLAGVNISVPGFSAAITDEKGKFSIKIPAKDVTLFISSDGFQKRQVPLRGDSVVNVRIYDESFDSYYATSALPAGSRSRNEVSAPAAYVSPGGAWARNQETPDNLLQGIASGLRTVRKSGTPGMGASMFLRGISSLYTTNMPLIVVDGIIFETRDFGGSLISGYEHNALQWLDVQDIDDISIIKDGTSTYGTKGANGVIYITTSRATEKATRIDVGLYTGVNFAPKNLPVMNAQQYRPYLADVLQSQGLSQQEIASQPYMTDDVNSTQYARYHYNTDWQKQVFDNSASNNAFLKISGGDNIASYGLSMNYARNEGVIKETDFSRLGTRFNADLNLTKRLTANSNLSFTYTQQKLRHTGISPKLNPIFNALVKSPFMAVNDISDKGAVSPNLADVDTLGYGNPASLVQKIIAKNSSYRFVGSLQFNYLVNNRFTISTRFGVTNDKIRENTFVPSKGIVHDTLQSAIAYNRSGSNVKRLLAVFSDTWVQYKETFKRKHVISAQAGVRYQQQSFEQDYALGYNSATDELINIGYGAAALREVGGDKARNRWLNTYINGDYAYDNRFFVTAGLTADGSSRFGHDIPGAFTFNGNNYAVLPYVAAAWQISSEQFMRSLPIVSLLKVRAAYSLSGNDDIGDYTARQYYVSQNLYGMQGLVRGNVANPHLQWESHKKLNLGVDVGVWDDRIRVSADVFHNTTRNMLVIEDANVAVGVDKLYSNSGSLQNNGVELNIDTRIINQRDLKWDLGVGIAAYRNKITSLPKSRIITSFAGGEIITAPGQAANLFYGYKTRGVYVTQAAAVAEGYTTNRPDGSQGSFGGGDMMFTDVNGDKAIDEKDKQVIGNPNPDYTGNINTVLTWKRFSLNALFTFSKGNDVYNYTRAKLESGADYSNQLVSMLNRWKTEGQLTNMPKATYGDPLGNSRFSDRWIEDGSYFRLRTISLSYNLKLKPGFLRYVTVYAAANNLLTITKYLGYDPEFSVTNSPLGQGVDMGLQPQFKSAQAGVKIGL